MRSLLLLSCGLAQACSTGPGAEPREAPVIPVFVHVPPPTDSRPLPPPEPAWIAGSRVPEFRKCAPCHRVERGAAHGLGPNLYGVFGRSAAAQPDYRYSPALRDSGLVWDFATLDRWLAGPRAAVPGTKMVFGGLRDPEERKAVIAFLRLRSAARP